MYDVLLKKLSFRTRSNSGKITQDLY